MAGGWDPFLDATAYLESGFNPTNKNPGSSARGAWQFLDRTAADSIKMGAGDPRAGGYDDQKKVTQAFIRKTNPRAAAALDQGDVHTAMALLKGTWPSLPGGSQPQNASQYAKFNQIINGDPNAPHPGGPVLNPTGNTPPPVPTYPQGTGQGSLDLLNQTPQQGTPAYDPMKSDWGSSLMQAGAALGANDKGGPTLAALANANRENMLGQQKLAIGETKVLDDGTVLKITPDGRAVPIYQGQQKLMQSPHQNMWGEKWNTLFNPYTGKETGIEGEGPQFSDELMQKIIDARQAGPNPGEDDAAFRKRLLDMAPAGVRGYTQALIEGREPPGGLGMGSKLAGPGIALAQTIEPVDVSVYSARKKMREDFASNAPNSMGGQMKSGGVAAKHLDSLTGAFEDLWAKNVPFDGKYIILNKATKMFEAETGHPEYNRIANELNNYTAERERMLTGGRPTIEGRASAAAPYLSTNSPDQIKAAIAADANFLDAKHSEFLDTWKQQMHLDKGPMDGGMMSKDSYDKLQRLKGIDPLTAKSPSYAPIGGPAVPPPKYPGQVGTPSGAPAAPTMVWDKALKRLVPIQQANPNGA